MARRCRAAAGGAVHTAAAAAAGNTAAGVEKAGVMRTMNVS